MQRQAPQRDVPKTAKNKVHKKLTYSKLCSRFELIYQKWECCTTNQQGC